MRHSMRVGGVGVVAGTWALFFPPPALEVFWEVRGTPPETPDRGGEPPLYSPKAVSSCFVNDYKTGHPWRGLPATLGQGNGCRPARHQAVAP
jgi:hypothetical protein